MKEAKSGSECIATAEDPRRLAEISLDLEHLLTRGDLPPPQFAVSEIKCETVQIIMRDGVRLASDLYLTPTRPAPVIVMRTPYGRAIDANAGAFLAFARRGSRAAESSSGIANCPRSPRLLRNSLETLRINGQMK